MLLLFDIDGTLSTGGPARTAFRLAMEATFGTAGPIDRHDFAGKTDTRTMGELLAAAGRDPTWTAPEMVRFRERYETELAARIGAQPVTVLPGVHWLIDRLAARDDLHLGLVTGNLDCGARLKLTSARLWHRFPIGAFGSDHACRNLLPGVALERAASHWKRPFHPRDAVVIGDTPRDVECGKAAGARTVAVATGRFTPSELHAAGADRVLRDFADTEAALEALTGAFPNPHCPAGRQPSS